MELHNRKARHNYNILETYEAGIKLTGSNVKQIVLHSLDISSSFCMIENGEIFCQDCLENNEYIFYCEHHERFEYSENKYQTDERLHVEKDILVARNKIYSECKKRNWTR